MTLPKALKTNLPLRRLDKTMTVRRNPGTYGMLMGNTSIAPNTWIDPIFLMYDILLEHSDFIADDWEVKWPEDYKLEMETVE